VFEEDLARLVGALVGDGIEAADSDALLGASGPDHPHVEVAVAGALGVHLEHGIVTDPHALRLDAATRRVALTSIHRYSTTSTQTASIYITD